MMPWQNIENLDPMDGVRVKLNSIGGRSFQSNGWADLNDAGTSIAPLAAAADTWVALTNDGLGPFTNTGYLPDGVTSLFDTATGKIDPRELNIGDVLTIRTDFEVINQVNGSQLSLRYTAGAGAGAYTLETQLGTLSRGAGRGYRFAASVDKIYLGDANTRDNLIGIEVKMSDQARITNNGVVITVHRRPNL